MSRGASIGLAGLLGCGPVISVAGDETGAQTSGAEGPITSPVTSAGSDPTVPPQTTAPVPPPPVTTDGTTTVDPTGGETEGGGTTDFPCDFICDPDGGVVAIQCSIWEQDCPAGEKCTPWAYDGGNSWNGTRCSPLADDAVGVGEVCTAEGSGLSGIDNCDGTSMCFGADEKTLQGTCYAFCTGDENSPMCADACATCNLSGSGVLTICIPSCDPISQDCPDGQACYPIDASYGCVPDASAGGGAAGEECEYINACAEGNFCLQSGAVPDCDGASGCCSPVCTVGDNTPCAVLPGTACIDQNEFDPPDACVPGNVGVCALP